ncbi:hypothetical protein PYW07_005539 [Mythimna separata]|uniref:Uncharacterized protein n=1 Tax=Mythimna separata TaxID=271217 RepID=A0AAD7YIY4_MYTSE|nr:hypothetical protein PYW07_005539 [Mythimna separata]
MSAASALLGVQEIQGAFRLLSTLHFTSFLWPQDAQVQDGFSFDFIVCGAGSAGSVIANRLTEIEDATVLLIEAGGDPPVESVIPGCVQYIKNTSVDWNFRTEDDGYSQQFHKNHGAELTRGKMLDSDYNRMPPLYHLDGFEECFDEPGAMYCYGEFAVVSEEPNELFTMMQEFSENFRHFNHTLLRYGYCMTKTCKEFYNGSTTEVDLRSSYEACSNETMYNKYKLKTRLTEELDCSPRDRDNPIDNLDIFVGVICILIVMANIIGSLCDRYLDKEKERGALGLLYNFSMSRNWKKFVANTGDGRDPRFKTLRGIHGIRAINITFVVVTHAFYAGAILIVNPKQVESWYHIKIYNMFMAGPLIMQSFFIVSSFLLVYNWMMDAEKRPVSWSMLPKQIIMRWLRLTPSYALIIGLTVTWFKRLASGGPIYGKAVYYEARDCRQDWWKHILYINNYVPRSHCMAQTCKAVNLFFGEPTFEKVFIRGHTNLAGCIIGMALGYIIYYWQKSGGDPMQFRKYRFIYWLSPIVGALIMFAGYIFFAEGVTVPTYVNLLYAGLQKPAFGLVIATIIAGLVIQMEGVFRPILEWRPFAFIGRLSYSVYLVHIAYIRTQIASMMSLQRTSIPAMILRGNNIVISVFIAAFFFFIMVEMPFANLVSNMFKRSYAKETVEESKKTEDDKGIDMSQTKTDDGTIVIKVGTKI